MSFLNQDEKTGAATEVQKDLPLHVKKPKGTVREGFELPIHPIRFLNKYKEAQRQCIGSSVPDFLYVLGRRKEL